jgi:cytoplasmic iron level regulating protein YaaA (DUF328/UPF0246 family)
MARYICENSIDQPDGLKSFSQEGYAFEPNLSQGNDWLFVRNGPA